MPFAARVGDPHVCPMFDGPKPHVGGPILPPGVPTVLIGGLPAATVGSLCTCASAPDVIIRGSPSVLIGGRMAARQFDTTAHGGMILMGCPTVLIGDVGIGPDLAALKDIVAAVNPLNGTVNCGNIIDAIVARLQGTDPTATAPIDQDGTWPEIEQRFNTQFTWGQTMNDAYSDVRNGGPGTTAIVGIKYQGGGSHVVVMTNRNGTVGILEGQDWGPGDGQEVITDVGRADNRYGADSEIGVAIVPPPTSTQP